MQISGDAYGNEPEPPVPSKKRKTSGSDGDASPAAPFVRRPPPSMAERLALLPPLILDNGDTITSTPGASGSSKSLSSEVLKLELSLFDPESVDPAADALANEPDDMDTGDDDIVDVRKPKDSDIWYVSASDLSLISLMFTAV